MHFYLSRLVYLDAVGSVDFTNINHTGLQVLITALNTFWSAIENKNDQFMQDALKFPLKNKFSRNDLQGERRKQNLSELRMNINTLKQGNRFVAWFQFLCVFLFDVCLSSGTSAVSYLSVMLNFVSL